MENRWKDEIQFVFFLLLESRQNAFRKFKKFHKVEMSRKFNSFTVGIHDEIVLC